MEGAQAATRHRGDDHRCPLQPPHTPHPPPLTLDLQKSNTAHLWASRALARGRGAIAGERAPPAGQLRRHRVSRPSGSAVYNSKLSGDPSRRPGGRSALDQRCATSRKNTHESPRQSRTRTAPRRALDPAMGTLVSSHTTASTSGLGSQHGAPGPCTEPRIEAHRFVRRGCTAAQVRGTARRSGSGTRRSRA